ncbi:MAG: hypothetical protein ACQERC_12800 [Bacteroidota bacterium]
MKHLFYLLISILFLCNTELRAQKDPQLVDIPHEVFVNDGRVAFDEILSNADGLKEDVRQLFEAGVLRHDLREENFARYWEAFEGDWSYIQFKKEDPPLLLFTGISYFSDEREYVFIYDLEEKEELYTSVGRLLAFKKHPFTGETVLYIHKYPCCKSASHHIISLRLIDNKIKTNNRFFVGRDEGDMVGPFFPDSANYPASYEQLEQKTKLYWSPEIVEKNAFLARSHKNAIISYEAGSLYKTLYANDSWKFVIMYSGIAEEKSPVLHYSNFSFRPVYGWMKNE